ncbi:LysM peptidoglycan-binding domain-containing protein [Bacillus tianshenii]|nr:LysM peptidoglycan-binding domain-containing protein [Bacillus tianshenii]
MTQKKTLVKKAGIFLTTAALSFTLFTTPTNAATKTYTVQRGDTLWKISKQFSVSVSTLRTLNGIHSDMLYVGDKLIYADDTRYIVKKGDTLWTIAAATGTTATKLKQANRLSSQALFVGQVLNLPQKQSSGQTFDKEVKPTTGRTYIVQKGDTLWKISQQFNTTVSEIKQTNHLTSDALYVGHTLVIPSSSVSTPTQLPKPAPQIEEPEPNPAPPVPTKPKKEPTPKPKEETKREPKQKNIEKSVTYDSYNIKRGDTIWNLSIEFGIPMSELLKVNGFSQSTSLSVGQEIQIPVHNVPVKQTAGADYGEELDWWTEAQYVFPIGKVAKITDFETGTTFMIKRTIGANHADSEPLTSKDAEIIKEVWGGEYSWNTRAVIVEVDGRRVAASMASMPHDIEFIKDNDYNGHFDLHFKNSTRHKDGKLDLYHQEQIAVSAGRN